MKVKIYRDVKKSKHNIVVKFSFLCSMESVIYFNYICAILNGNSMVAFEINIILFRIETFVIQIQFIEPLLHSYKFTSSISNP